MSFLRRLFGSRPQGDPYAAGLSLYEEGRFAEAIAMLRPAARRGGQSVAGALASFYLKQAMVCEGRRLLQAGRAGPACRLLTEAAASGDAFADVQFLCGLSQGMAGDWETALRTAGRALRLNADYCEARLLEATSLAQLGRGREAAESLNKLLESGRRVNHPLIEILQADAGQDEGFDEARLPERMLDLLTDCIAEDRDQPEMGQAVALCRAGRWSEGLERLRDLVLRRPTYADYRLKLAAALFHSGEIEAAEAEVGEALRLNPGYRAAACLKVLILASRRRLEAARRAVNDLPSAGRPSARVTQEDLLISYLAAVLDLLTGRLAAAEDRLANWDELPRIFPYAQLLLVAVAELRNQPEVALHGLEMLLEAWPSNGQFYYFHMCRLLKSGQLDRLKSRLVDWPAADVADRDQRPLWLAAQLAAARDLPVDLPAGEIPERWQPAWRFLEARNMAARGDWAGAWQQADALVREGLVTDALARCLAVAAANLSDAAELPHDWLPPVARSEALLPDLVFMLNRHGRSGEADACLRPYLALHPEDSRWTWLSVATWIDPVRRWIS